MAALAGLQEFVPGGGQSRRVICPEEIGNRDDYLFPAPGRSNRLANWPERYHDLLGVVDTDGFESSGKAELYRFVQNEFTPIVEEAANEGGN